VPNLGWSTKKFILIVDDDDSTRMMLRTALESEGYHIIEAINGDQAIEQCITQPINLILMDVNMPKTNGIEVCRHIRTELKMQYTPIIMLTSERDTKVIEVAFDAGSTDFITKPINWSLLSHRLRYILRNQSIAEDLSRRRQQLKKASKIALIGHWEFEPVSEEIHLSDNARDLYGLKKCEDRYAVSDFVDRLADNERDELFGKLQVSLKNHTHGEMEHRWENIKNNNRVFQLHWGLIENDPGRLPYILGISQDITDKREIEEVVEHQMYYDHLTNIPNRRLFERLLDRAKSTANENGTLIAVLFIDADRFKNVNDTLGHKCGDAVIVSMARRISECVWSSDTVCRISGDEFAVILENITDVDQVINLTQIILDAIAKPHSAMGQDIHVTVSIGIALYPGDTDSSEDLLANADSAMFYAKKNGGGTLEVYHPDMNIRACERLRLERDLRDALERNEFELFYQPQICISSQELIGVEALIRWNHPTRGMVSPLDFIPIAEETGLIYAIGKWVIREAIATARTLNQNSNNRIRMGINLSPRQFGDSDLAEYVENIIQKIGVDVGLIDLEITESLAMHDIDKSLLLLDNFKHVGVRLSIDDFGTGYSSLSYLQKMPVDTLKIDRSFISPMSDSVGACELVKAIISMAHVLNLEVIAEGVETDEQLSLLHGYDCDIAQGYLYSPPLPLKQLWNYISSFNKIAV